MLKAVKLVGAHIVPERVIALFFVWVAVLFEKLPHIAIELSFPIGKAAHFLFGFILECQEEKLYNSYVEASSNKEKWISSATWVSFATNTCVERKCQTTKVQ